MSRREGTRRDDVTYDFTHITVHLFSPAVTSHRKRTRHQTHPSTITVVSTVSSNTLNLMRGQCPWTSSARRPEASGDCPMAISLRKPIRPEAFGMGPNGPHNTSRLRVLSPVPSSSPVRPDRPRGKRDAKAAARCCDAPQTTSGEPAPASTHAMFTFVDHDGLSSFGFDSAAEGPVLYVRYEVASGILASPQTNARTQAGFSSFAFLV